MQWKPNVTVAAVIERNRRFLFVEETSKGSLVLNQPAGHLEENESLIDAVKREVLEESGWHFTPHRVTGIYLYTSPSSDITYLRVCFAGSCHTHQVERALDEGIVRALWLDPDELDKYRLRSPMVRQCVEDYLSGQSFPLSYLKHYLPGPDTLKSRRSLG